MSQNENRLHRHANIIPATVIRLERQVLRTLGPMEGAAVLAIGLNVGPENHLGSVGVRGASMRGAVDPCERAETFGIDAAQCRESAAFPAWRDPVPSVLC